MHVKTTTHTIHILLVFQKLSS